MINNLEAFFRTYRYIYPSLFVSRVGAFWIGLQKKERKLINNFVCKFLKVKDLIKNCASDLKIETL